jgi:Fe-S cluster assembly protein SufD
MMIMSAVSAPAFAFNDSGFTEFLDSRTEPEWLRAQREKAWETYSQMQWPARNAEEWIRTDTRLFKLEKYQLAAPEAAKSGTWKPHLSEGVEFAGASSHLDGKSASFTLEPALAAKGVLFGDLDQYVLSHGDLLKPYLNRLVSPEIDRYSALHAAFWNCGHLLYVPRGVTIEKPFYAATALSDGQVCTSHTLVILEEGASATFLSESASVNEQGSGLQVGGTEIQVKQGSNLRYVHLQDWGKGVWCFGHKQANVGQDANLQWTLAAIGSRLAKVNQHVALTGPGASAQVNGVLFTEGSQHLSYHTLQHHKAPHCKSDFLYKAALQDQSRTVWRGMIKVDKGASKTDGYQRNDNLLLSRTARADSIPGLEINHDDVRCTHGSTSGKVDEELIFYAQCRGYTRKEAIRMIVSGFFQQIFDRITIDSVRDALARVIATRVHDIA